MKGDKSYQGHHSELISSMPEACQFVFLELEQHTFCSVCKALVTFVWLVWPVLPSIRLSSTSQKHHFIFWLRMCHLRSQNHKCGRQTVQLPLFTGALYHPDSPEVCSFIFKMLLGWVFRKPCICLEPLHGMCCCLSAPLVHSNCAVAELVAFWRI